MANEQTNHRPDDLQGAFDKPVSRARPHLPDSDWWVFGYGSLMWHPGFPHLEVRPARLHGYHRRFCVYSTRYRGTPCRPGLVLGLDRGGSCRGMAFRVPKAEGPAVLDYLWEREMVTGVYLPRWQPCFTPDGTILALCFVADPAHVQYTGRLSLEQTAELILQGVGMRGPCREYLVNTNHHLEALGIRDHMLRRLIRLIDARSSGEPSEARGETGTSAPNRP